MKSLNIFFLALIFACNFVSAQDTLYIFRAGEVIEKHVVTQIDSITFHTIDTLLNYPTKLITPTSSDIIDNSIRLKWEVTETTYSRIDVCLNNTSVLKSISLTASDNIAGEKIVTGLKPTTMYYLKIFEGDTFKGEKVVSTIAAQKYTGDVVDLRGYSDASSLNLLTQTFIDSLSAEHQSGFNLLLSGGAKYIISSIAIPVKMNIVTGMSFKGKATMAINGNFTVPAATTVGSIRFENVFFDQGTITGKYKTDANYGATYVFNFNNSDGNVDSLKVENCVIKYKRGFIRMQTSAIIQYMSINNCEFDSIAGYGLINNANDASYIGDIEFKNSTVSHTDKLFTGGRALGINSITLDFITTCYAPASGNYFLDYANNAISGGITVRNSVFGIGSGSALVNGMRSSCGNISVSNCYKTSDLGWVLNSTSGLPNAPIPSVVDLESNSTQIFAAPTAYNFKVTDARLVNLVGDPRWW
jgi:hypothetical protein